MNLQRLLLLAASSAVLACGTKAEPEVISVPEKFGCFYEQDPESQKQGYELFYATDLENRAAMGNTFTLAEFENSFSPSQKVLDALDDLVVGAALNQADIDGSSVEDIQRIFTQTDLEITPSTASETALDEYVERSHNAVDDFLRFVGSNECIAGLSEPDVRFQEARESMEIEERTDQHIPIIFGNTKKFLTRATYEITIGNTVYESKVSATEAAGGCTLTKYNINPRTARVGIGTFPVVVGLEGGEGGAATTYTSPLAEVLHSVATLPTGKHLTRDITIMWNDLGQPSLDDPTFLRRKNEIQQTWVVREEGVVHALVDAYLDMVADDVGISQEAVREYDFSLSQNEVYVLRKPLARTLDRMGPTNFFAAYVSNPEELF